MLVSAQSAEMTARSVTVNLGLSQSHSQTSIQSSNARMAMVPTGTLQQTQPVGLGYTAERIGSAMFAGANFNAKTKVVINMHCSDK